MLGLKKEIYKGANNIFYNPETKRGSYNEFCLHSLDNKPKTEILSLFVNVLPKDCKDISYDIINKHHSIYLYRNFPVQLSIFHL